jgi:hypothetical protein
LVQTVEASQPPLPTAHSSVSTQSACAPGVPSGTPQTSWAPRAQVHHVRDGIWPHVVVLNCVTRTGVT